MSGLPDGTRVTISGNPTPEEIAAVLTALDTVAASDRKPQPRRPGWQEAARREAVGGRAVRSRADLTTPAPGIT